MSQDTGEWWAKTQVSGGPRYTRVVSQDTGEWWAKIQVSGGPAFGWRSSCGNLQRTNSNNNSA